MPRSKKLSDEAVLEAAEAVLLEHGPHTFTLAQVSKKVGIAPATLIQRFGSKQGLLRAFAKAAATRGSGNRGGTREGVSSRHRRDDRLSPAVSLLLGRAAKLGDRRRFVNSMALLLEDVRDPVLRRHAARHALETDLALARLLADAGLAHPERAARLLYAAFNGALIQWALRGEGTLEAYLRRTLRDAMGLLRAS